VADVGITPTSHFHRGLTVRISFPPLASLRFQRQALFFGAVTPAGSWRACLWVFTDPRADPVIEIVGCR